VKPVFITPEGLLLSDNKTPSTDVETLIEEPLHVIAAREAEKQSTKVKEAK
jgi:hypothetical protein